MFRTRTAVVASAALFVAGLGLSAAMLVALRHSPTSPLPGPASVLDHLAITGLLFMISGFSTFCFTLLLHATEVRYGTGVTMPATERSRRGVRSASSAT